MNEETLLTTLLATSYTKSDIFRRLRLYRSFLEHTFFKKGKKTLAVFLEDAGVSKEDALVIVGWGSAFHKSFTKENAYDILEKLSVRLKKIPAVSLYIPYDPSHTETVKLGTWFRTNVDKSLLLDIHSDPGLLGGMAFAWKGHYRDYSLRHYLTKKKHEIHDLLDRYAAGK